MDAFTHRKLTRAAFKLNTPQNALLCPPPGPYCAQIHNWALSRLGKSSVERVSVMI
jgi:hypothetical protein